MQFTNNLLAPLWAIACICSLHPPSIVAASAIIDEDDNIESIASVVCETTKGTAYQLSRISTIGKLVKFLESANESNKELYSCRNKYLGSLVELNHLLATANEDVCGDEKLHLIERYHKRFVSKVVDGLELKAPKVANLLFMQYAKRVSSICEQQAVKVLKQVWRKIEAEEEAKFEKMRLFIDALGMSDLSQGYNGMYLFWNMVDLLPLERNEKISRYLTRRGETRVNVQMRDAEPILGIQALCRYKFFPLYSRSILPVLRLVDMGYYPEDKQLIDGIKHDPYTTSMFIQTQLCETLGRIRVFADATLEGDKIVAITLEDAAKLPTPPELPGLDKIAETQVKYNHESSFLVGLDQLLDGKEGRQEIERIKSVVQSRAKVMNRVLKTLMANLKGKLKSKVKNLFLGAKNGNGQNLQEALDDSLKGLNEIQAFSEEEASNEEKGLVRHRRGIKKTLKTVRKFFVSFLVSTLYIIYVVALLCIKLAVLLVPLLIALYMIGTEIAGLDNSFVKGVGFLWRFGWDPTDPMKYAHLEYSYS